MRQTVLLACMHSLICANNVACRMSHVAFACHVGVVQLNAPRTCKENMLCKWARCRQKSLSAISIVIRLTLT